MVRRRVVQAGLAGLVLGALVAFPAQADPGHIDTVVGGGVGDGVSARQSWIEGVGALHVAGDGSLLVADERSSLLRRITAGADGVVTGDGDDVITTLAGNGDDRPGLPPDGAVATEWPLPFPEAVAELDDSSVLVGAHNHVLRVDADGRIHRVAGTDGFVGSGRGDGGPATDARFNGVKSLLVAGDRLYVGEHGHVRLIDLNTGIISTVAGRPTCGLDHGPGDGGHPLDACFRYARGLALDSTGALVISDEFHDIVRRITPGVDGVVDGSADEVIDRIVGTGRWGGDAGSGAHPRQVRSSYPQEVAIDSAGRLYVGTGFNVLRVDPGADGVVDGSADEQAHVVAGDGTRVGSGRDGHPAVEASTYYVSGIAVDSHDRLLAGEASTQHTTGIFTIEGDGAFRYVAGLGTDVNGKPATEVRFRSIDRVELHDGGLYFSRHDVEVIHRVDPATGTIVTVAGGGINTALWGALGVPATAYGFFELSGFDVGPDGTLWAVDSTGVHKVRPGADGVVDGDSDEQIETVNRRLFAGPDAMPPDAYAGRAGEPTSITVSPDGDVYVTERARVWLLDQELGLLRHVAGTGQSGTAGDCASASADDCLPARQASFHSLFDVEVGPGGRLYVVDRSYGLVRMITPGADGVVDGDADELVHTVVGQCRRTTVTDCPVPDAGGLHPNAARTSWLEGVAVAGGEMWIAAALADTVLHVHGGADGVVDGSSDEVATIAAGQWDRSGFGGDGGPAADSWLRNPGSVAIDETRLVIADVWNGRVRSIQR